MDRDRVNRDFVKRNSDNRLIYSFYACNYLTALHENYKINCMSITKHELFDINEDEINGYTSTLNHLRIICFVFKFSSTFM